MEESRLTYLLEQYADGGISMPELTELTEFLRQEDSRELFTGILPALMERYPAKRADIVQFDDLSVKVLQYDHAAEAQPMTRSRVVRGSFLGRWYIAASLLLVLAAGAFWWLDGRNNIEPDVAAADPVEIPPGKDGAILTLADGSQVLLDTIQQATIALEYGVVAKISDGMLIYEGKAGAVLYNTLSTPKGRQYHLTLPDGSEVWLNAGSAIRYPITFTGAERLVEATGELYFEVVKNAGRPFRVKINNNATVEVLGTQFNINAYENEASIKTTLLEGSVLVSLPASENSYPGHAAKAVLKPGQQAQVPRNAVEPGITVLPSVDTGKVMAWKHGIFNFEGATLTDIMRAVERWYDIEVVIDHNVPVREFEGEMTRDVTLNGLMIALEKLGVHHKLEGRKLYILP